MGKSGLAEFFRQKLYCISGDFFKYQKINNYQAYIVGPSLNVYHGIYHLGNKPDVYLEKWEADVLSIFKLVRFFGYFGNKDLKIPCVYVVFCQYFNEQAAWYLFW